MISSNFPNFRPSALLDFANSRVLDTRITFARTSTARYYDGITTSKAEENLFLYSQVFSNASWTKVSATATDNNVTAPDGTTTGALLTFSSGSHVFRQDVAVLPSTQYTFSFYAKRGTMLDMKYRVYNLSVAGDIVSPTSYYSSTSSSSWTRIVLTFTTPSNCSSAGIYLSSDTLYTGTAYFWGAQLEARSSETAYTTTTSASITNYIPALRTASANIPRFDFNPTTSESLGLRVEDARTNLLTYSEDFSQAITQYLTLYPAYNIAPDGTKTATLIVPHVTSGEHFVSKSVSVAVSTIYTYSVYAKRSGNSIFYLRTVFSNGANDYITYFDLSNGTVNSANGNHSNITITPVGNSWYRCSISYTTPASLPAANLLFRFQSSPTAVASFSGNDYNGAFVWGQQVEDTTSNGGTITSYISTSSSTVTRAADSVSISNLSSFYNPNEGGLFIEARHAPYGNQGLISLYYDSSNRMGFQSAAATSSVHRQVSNSVNFQEGSATYTQDTFIKAMFAYSAGSQYSAINGSSNSSQTGATLPNVTILGIGYALAVYTMTGWIKKIAYYPIKPTLSNVQNLTLK